MRTIQQAVTFGGPAHQVAGLSELFNASTMPNNLLLMPVVLHEVRKEVALEGDFIVAEELLRKWDVVPPGLETKDAMAVTGVHHSCKPSTQVGSWCSTSFSELRAKQFVSLSALLPEMTFALSFVQPASLFDPTASTAAPLHDAILIERGTWQKRPRTPAAPSRP